MSLYQAGGHENLPKQIAQFDDCMAGKADAIITGSISEVGMGKKFKKVVDGASQIGMVNPVGNNTPMTAKVFVRTSRPCQGHRRRSAPSTASRPT